jgi:hypothetical protein
MTPAAHWVSPRSKFVIVADERHAALSGKWSHGTSGQKGLARVRWPEADTRVDESFTTEVRINFYPLPQEAYTIAKIAARSETTN